MDVFKLTVNISIYWLLYWSTMNKGGGSLGGAEAAETLVLYIGYFSVALQDGLLPTQDLYFMNVIIMDVL